MTDSLSVEDRTIRLLEAHPFSTDLEPVEIELLAGSASLEDFEAGSEIFAAGNEATTFYLLRSGLVALRIDSGASVPRTIQQISEGSALGWSWLFEPYVWQFSAVAVTPVRAIGMDAAELRRKFEENPSCGYHVLAQVSRIMADRLHATRHQVVNLVG